MPYTSLVNSYSGLMSTTSTNAKATTINDNNYSCHITAIEVVQPIVWGLYHTTSRH